MKINLKRILLITLALFVVSYAVFPEVRRTFSIYAKGESDLLAQYDFNALTVAEKGAVYFVGGDFGGLSTDTLRGSAAPWILAASALTLDYVDGDLERVGHAALANAFQQWGFTSPEHIANWPENLSDPELSAPLGLSIGSVARTIPPIEVTAANITCSSCHSNPAYDETGLPDPNRAWLGTPSSSINLEAYPKAIYDAFLRFGEDPKLMQAADKLFPDMSKTQRSTLTKFVLPAAQKRMAELKNTLGRAVPFKGGYPGATNGLDSLHIRLGLQSREQLPELSAFNSIPNIDGHVFRTSFLNVANYELPKGPSDRTIQRADITDAHLDDLGAMAAFFTVPSMGVDLATAREQIPKAQATMHFIKDVQTQPFPGTPDPTLVNQGAAIYENQCASCHGQYDENGKLNSFPNYVGRIGTDTLRMDLLTSAKTANAVNKTIMGDYIRAVDPVGYSAPSLNGIWATAPYLHNGSVPTLHHLFNPETRPSRFYVGGQKLNFDLVGIDGRLDEQGVWVYPEGYVPWAKTVLIDTEIPGLSSKGHNTPFDTMSDADKSALLEYLKTL